MGWVLGAEKKPFVPFRNGVFFRKSFLYLGLTNDPHGTSVHKKFVCFFAPSFCETPAETRIPHGYPQMTFRTFFFALKITITFFWGYPSGMRLLCWLHPSPPVKHHHAGGQRDPF